MAVEKILNTKIRLLTRTYEEWTTTHAADVLLKGEIGICEIPANGIATTAPTVLFKVGDGELPYYNEDPSKCLKWASALAADVYAWAKQANLPVVRADEKNEDGTDKAAGNVISSIYWDEDGIKYTTASVATSEGMATLQQTVADIAKDIADNRDAWAKDDNDNTTYQFSVPTEGNDKGKLLVEKKEIGEFTWTRVDAYDFVTPAELNEILANYYTKSEVDDLIQDVRDDIPTELGVMSVELLPGTTNGSLKLKVNDEAGEDVVVTGLEEIKVKNAAHADAAGQVDKTLTVKVGGETKTYNGSADVEADVDAAITAAINAIPEVVHPEYSIVKDPTSDYAATYHLTKDGVNVGAAINIPKDMVVESGEVKELEAGTWGEAGTYIVITLANATDDKLYINVGDLIEYVTGGNTADIEVSVDPTTHVVTAILTQTVKDNIALGVTAHGWGNHASAGYAANDDLTKVINGTTPVAKATDADKLGGQLPAYYATADSVTEITKDNGTIDSKIKEVTDTFGDIITHNAGEFATSAQGGKADTALQNVEVGTGLKVSEKAENKQTIEIDTDVVFILNCNY